MAAAYAGNIMPKEAWEMLANDPKAVLVDVRTSAEWSFVGVPDLSGLGKRPLFASWVMFPAMDRNEKFAIDIEEGIPDRTAPVLFLCRSGARSQAAAAAMTQRGYSHCYNIVNGFEGDKDKNEHRNTLGGWRADSLPWVQG